MTTQIKGNDTSTFGGNVDVPQIITDAPAFRAYPIAGQSISSNVFTKIVLDGIEFDTNNNFDNTTNYRFTPNVEGYYQVNAVIRGYAANLSRISVSVYKNGSSNVQSYDWFSPLGATRWQSVSGLIYMNGTTDYLEMYGYINGSTAPSIGVGNTDTIFNGFLARAV